MINTIAFLGAGNMASALIRGLIAHGFAAEQLWASDPDEGKLSQLHASLGIHTSADNAKACIQANTIVLAVKPQILNTVCDQIRPVIENNKPLVLSIAAGIPCSALSLWLGNDTPIVRTMPNTPASINCGATGLYATPSVSEEQKTISESIMQAVGITAWVEEEAQLDIVTAVSGSGPAYYFLFMEAMEKAATQLGLPQETARLLALQTAYGAANMALNSEESTEVLRQRVTSPGGTTEQAINTFEDGQLRDLVYTALAAANKRSKELAHQFGGGK